MKTFRVALTADFYTPDGAPRYRDLGLATFASCPHITAQPLAKFEREITPEQAEGVQGLVVLTPAVTARTVSRANDLLAVGRFGVGYDAVDVPACTAVDVVVFITAGAVDRSV